MVYFDVDFERPSGGEAGDYRSAFAHDRDRILYARAFARLADKTQVVAVGEAGNFHTRLTHSLKVAQVGKRLAEQLNQKAIDAGHVDPQSPVPVPSPELVEAACLAHDIGHPPFGHVGEEALRECVDRELGRKLERTTAGEPTAEERSAALLGDGSFEGNAQSFRILGYLETHRASRGRGLDLTRATLDAATKYPWCRGSDGKAARKWGFYGVDAQLMEWVRNTGGPLDHPQPISLEAQLMDWCDDVTYAVHDVEDFYRYGFIPLDRLFASPSPHITVESEEQSRFFDYLEGSPELHWFDRNEARKVWRSISNLITVPGPYRPTRDVEIELDRTRSNLITLFVDSVNYEGAAPARLEATLKRDELANYATKVLNQLIWFYVIQRPGLSTQQEGKRHIVTSLLDTYYRQPFVLLPDDRQEEAKEHGDALRACVDHVASLTEPQALALHRRFSGAELGDMNAPIWSV